MGSRGPLPQSSRLKALRGETRRSRLNPNEPVPRNVLPVRPADLNPAAGATWDQAMTEMAETGVWTGADTWVLRLFVDAVARYERAAKLLDESMPLLAARGHGARAGELVKNPLNQTVRDEANLVRTLARDLGLSPGARANLKGYKPPLSEADRRFEALMHPHVNRGQPGRR